MHNDGNVSAHYHTAARTVESTSHSRPSTLFVPGFSIFSGRLGTLLLGHGNGCGSLKCHESLCYRLPSSGGLPRRFLHSCPPTVPGRPRRTQQQQHLQLEMSTKFLSLSYQYLQNLRCRNPHSHQRNSTLARHTDHHWHTGKGRWKSSKMLVCLYGLVWG